MLLRAFGKSAQKVKKGMLVGGLAAIVVLIAAVSLLAGKTSYTPLYNNLSAQEVAQIKAELDNKKGTV
ncbi:hypothetical protein RWE15_21035 [Virgibacillus halophilus]|uniref:Uncharacterized protein n=1 Tax=Tigheibacillus halophilus TaxID=361280 RepID=A0ABU5CAT9_9BACI|nr:hypothetical protein [Virgibacillus halophilus]